MSAITLYHNPNCSKSRGARDILEAKDIDFEIVEYLDTPLSVEQLRSLLGMLPDEPEVLVRKDSHFKELGLEAGDYTTVGAVASLLAEHPRLMQRPVAVRDGKALIARPSELVKELL